MGEELIINEGEVSRWSEEAKDRFWAFNGLRHDGQVWSLSIKEFVSWCKMYHPEYLDLENNDFIEDIVLSLFDALTFNDPDLEGAIAVTIRPDIDGNVSYAEAAKRAAQRHYDPLVRSRFLMLASRLDDAGFDKKPEV